MSDVIRTGTMNEDNHKTLCGCAADGVSTLNNEMPPVKRSSTNCLKTILENPNKFGELNSVGETVAAGATGLSVLTLGGLRLPFALYGVQGAVMFKTYDGTKSGFGLAFENPENGKNQIYLTADGGLGKP